MTTYRVKYTLEKVVEIEAKDPQEAVTKAASLEDFNFDFFGDRFEAEEMQTKIITTALYIKGTGISSLSRKPVLAIPSLDIEFENVESIKFLQLEPDFVEIQIHTFNLNSRQVMELVENICETKLN